MSRCDRLVTAGSYCVVAPSASMVDDPRIGRTGRPFHSDQGLGKVANKIADLV